MTLVEAFRNLQVEEEESLENGDMDHEVTHFLFQLTELFTSIVSYLACFSKQQLIYFFFSQEVVAEENGNEQRNEDDVAEHVEEHHEEKEAEEEEGIVDGDSTDGAVLVNGSEADEEWGTNNEGNPSA